MVNALRSGSPFSLVVFNGFSACLVFLRLGNDELTVVLPELYHTSKMSSTLFFHGART
jgi:hypothetical protein